MTPPCIDIELLDEFVASCESNHREKAFQAGTSSKQVADSMLSPSGWRGGGAAAAGERDGPTFSLCAEQRTPPQLPTL